MSVFEDLRTRADDPDVCSRAAKAGEALLEVVEMALPLATPSRTPITHEVWVQRYQLIQKWPRKARAALSLARGETEAQP